MEEKINTNQKIFNYIPSLIMKLILDNPLKDKDVFCDSIKNKTYQNHFFNNNNSTKSNSLFVFPDIYPIINDLPSSLIMIIKLGGFNKLISTLVLKDQKNQKEKLISEYLSNITPRILLKVSSIIGENGGEIVKYNDFELIALWLNNNNKASKIYTIYNKFNAKLALITATELMKKVDKTEISRGVELELSIGISLGDISCVFFGGERKRAEYIFLGEGLNNAQKCLLNCLPHEIMIDKELNELFQKGGEISTIHINEEKKFFSLMGYNEEELKDFNNFKGIKLKNNNIFLNKTFHENLESKLHIALSIIPSGLLKYMDLGVDTNSQEINILTIETIVIYLDNKIMNDLKEIQNIISDIQKSIYLSFGILIYISKIHSGLLIRCVWGIDPSSFIDDTARAISTASIIGNLTKYYKMKIGIGIATGSCFSGLISLQGNKKVYTLLGKKALLSRLLAEEACDNIDNDSKIKYVIYCDKQTMNYSQKWYRHIFVSQLKIYLTKKDDIFDKYKIEFFDGRMDEKIKQIKLDKNDPIKDSNIVQNSIDNFFDKDNLKTKKEELEKQLFTDNINELESKNLEEYKQIKNKICIENEYYMINDVYSPIEEEEYFFPSYYDPFPLIRTHLNNSFSSKNDLYFKNILQIKNNEDIYQSKIPKIRKYSMSTSSINKAQSHTKLMLKLKKSQTIFGHSYIIKKILNIMNLVYKNNERQFFLIRGPLGIGKTLLVRKCLNNFIGINDFMSRNYFMSEQFLFCNIVKPLNRVLPFNTVNYILRELFLNIKKIKKIKELYLKTITLNLSNEDLKDISFILSIGKDDINLEEEFFEHNMEVMIEKEVNKDNNKNKKKMNKVTKEKSYVKYLEGPFDFKDKYKIYEFFFIMIISYKEYLNNKKHEHVLKLNPKERRSNKSINRLPLIFVIDDLHFSDDFSLEFIQYLFNNEKQELNPFYIILIEQTPFNEKFPPLIHRSFENFLFFVSEYSEKPKTDKVIKFDMKPLIEKYNLQKLIIFYNKESVMKKYKTNLESVDDKILEFLLMKTFNGIPLLALSLFDSLIKSEKFIQKLSGEFIITSELIDDNIMHDWSDLLLPYIFEKIDTMMFNNLLSYKEIMIIKFASIIGNIFDLKTLDKLNPLKNIIKIKDMEKLLLKLNNEYLLEIYYPEIEKKKNKIQNIVCQLTFPLIREILHQKIPMERRAMLHMKMSKILSTSKRNGYFSIENELKIFKRHLLYSEMNIIKEMESKDIKTVQDILQNKKELNYNNLKLYVVKEIFSKYYSEYTGNIMEGNLEILYNNRWLKISYFIDISSNIYINFENPKLGTNEIIMTIPIKSIYKNKILSKNLSKMKSNNMLAIYQTLGSEPLKFNNKKIILLSSEQREEICKLDIAINFLRVKANYDKYVLCFGYIQFPLYKIKWYKQKKDLIYSRLEQNGITIKINKTNNLINYNNMKYSEANITEKIEDIKSSFKIIFQSTFSIFLGKIQEQLTKIKEKKSKSNNNINLTTNNNLVFLIPKHLKRKINNSLKISLNNVNKDLKRINNVYFRKSLSINNPFHSFFSLNNDSKNKIYETEGKNNEKEELQEIKEVSNKSNKKPKIQKDKVHIRKNKIIGSIIMKDTKKVFNKIMEKKIEQEKSIIKKDYQTLNKIINTKETNAKKPDETDDINIPEFNLEDDAPINISINNITKAFNSSNYITTNSDSNQDKKLNLSDSD